jgi:heptaprenyl diphosphate synthase
MKRAELWRRRRREWFDGLFPGKALFIAALVIMPALLFNPDTRTRVLQFFFFWFLAWLSGRKNNPLITILIVLVIVFFNLLVPYGRIIYSLGPFRITVGALLAGIHRAVTLEALIMLSGAAIRPDVRFPGVFGEILGESFRIFGRITERKITVKGGDIAAGIDRLMLELSEEASSVSASGLSPDPDRKKLSPPALVCLVLTVLLSWLPLFLSGEIKTRLQ